MASEAKRLSITAPWVWTATTAGALVLGYQVFLRRRRLFKNDDFHTLPPLLPWYLPSLLGLLPLIKAGSMGAYLRDLRERFPCHFAFGTRNFIFNLGSKTAKRSVLICHPDDITKIGTQQRKLEMLVAVPETVHAIHGPKNLQNLTGAEHLFFRKIFSSLLSPRALEAFVANIFQEFHNLWDTMEQGAEIRVRDEIRKSMFRLMSKILYGMEAAEDEPGSQEQLQQMQRNFELEDAALFAPPGSKTFREGMAASQATRRVLWARFQAILKEEKKKQQQDESNEEKNQPDGEEEVTSPVGNALEAIAQALVKSEKQNEPEALQGISDNILLLLEASHGTSMHVTTSLLYLLNHPDNLACLERAQREVEPLFGDNSAAPTLADLKYKLPYCEACIHETMRIIPIIGTVGMVLPEGKTVELKSGAKLDGPMILHLNSSQWYLDPDTFPEPNRFVPERWLAKDSPGVGDPSIPDHFRNSKLAKQVYQPFGHGQHMCLGMNLARLVLKANLACFCRDPQRRLMYDVQAVQPNYGIFPERQVRDGFPAVLTLVDKQ